MIEKIINEIHRLKKELDGYSASEGLDYIESYINIIQREQPEVDLELVTGWFEHIAQIADDRKTLTGEVMEDSYALDEIKSIAKNSVYYIEHHAHTLGLENARKEE